MKKKTVEMTAQNIECVPPDVKALLERIDDLLWLLVCYRIGSRPPEKLFDRLDRSKVAEDHIRARYNEHNNGYWRNR